MQPQSSRWWDICGCNVYGLSADCQRFMSFTVRLTPSVSVTVTR